MDKIIAIFAGALIGLGIISFVKLLLEFAFYLFERKQKKEGVNISIEGDNRNIMCGNGNRILVGDNGEEGRLTVRLKDTTINIEHKNGKIYVNGKEV